VTILNQIYEVDFKGFSYGFRPGRDPHQALDALYVGLIRKRVNWVLDADIRGFFDKMSHEWTLKFIEHRVADRRILRLIQKWLKAGVSEDGQWSETKLGTPQGAVVSPLLANVYLQYRTDAERFLRDFQERLVKFGLELHPDKTRLIEFGRFAFRDRERRGEGKPETFVFLGFTHYCGHLRSSGAFTVWRITAMKRMVAKLKAIKAELQHRKHHRSSEVGEWLRKVVMGYYQYHAVPGNSSQLRLFRRRVCRLWRSILVRRSQRAQVRWERLAPLLDRWIPLPRILHPHPNDRFYATHPW